jgi:uncharacterized repeat protein (TIGR01451 family)
MGLLRRNKNDGLLKRLAVRLSVFTAIGALGFFAIARAQRSGEETADDNATAESSPDVGESKSASPAPTTLIPNGGDSLTAPPNKPEPRLRQPAIAPPGAPINSNRLLPVSPAPGEGNPLRGSVNGTDPAPAARMEVEPRHLPVGDAALPVESPRVVAPSLGRRVNPGAIPAGTNGQIGNGAPDAIGTRAVAPPYGDLYRRPAANEREAAAAINPAPNLRNAGADTLTPNSRSAAIPSGNRALSAIGPTNTSGLPSPSLRNLSAGSPLAATSLPANQKLGSDQPGSRQLEGPQAPSLTLEKSAPAEIQVGKPAKFKITVRNTGTVPASQVKVFDRVPVGTRLLATKPQAAVGRNGALIWVVGTLQPDDEKTLEMQLMPEQEGEIGSVATLTFQAEASVRTVATKPDVTLDVTAPDRVLIGEQLTMKIKVTNQGTGVASNIVLFDSLPPQVRHPQGNELEYDIGDLKPNETREINLTLTGASPGQVARQITARGDGSISAEAPIAFEVVAPALKVNFDGPTLPYLERQAVYTFSVSNPGTAPAHGIELVSHLPKAMKFVSANNSGYYDSKSHSVFWSLSELPEGEVGKVKLVTMPVEAGKHTMHIESKGNLDLSDSLQETIVVDGLPALSFEVVDLEDPVAVGGETGYEIRVLNQGTKTANNIRLVALVPPQLRALSADGPTQSTVDGGRVIFAPLQRLAPKADATYRIKVQGVVEGDQRMRVLVQSDEMDSPVTKEESTRVYKDR